MQAVSDMADACGIDAALLFLHIDQDLEQAVGLAAMATDHPIKAALQFR
jgi:hypothetical protein